MNQESAVILIYLVHTSFSLDFCFAAIISTRSIFYFLRALLQLVLSETRPRNAETADENGLMCIGFILLIVSIAITFSILDVSIAIGFIILIVSISYSLLSSSNLKASICK